MAGPKTSTDGGQSPQYPIDPYPVAHVIFSDHTDLGWLRYLKSGFRHCAVIIESGDGWISIDPLSHMVEIGRIATCHRTAIVKALRRAGHRVVTTHVQPCPRKPAPWALFSCVELVKRVLGIQKRRLLTPFQLYRFLIKRRPVHPMPPTAERAPNIPPKNTPSKNIQNGGEKRP